MGRTGRTRRTWILAVVALLAFAGWAATGSSAGAARSFEDFTVYGEAGVKIGDDTKITGIVGARSDRTNQPYPHSAISMGGNTGVVGAVLAGQNVQMLQGAKIDGPLTYVGNLSKQASSIITGAIVKAPDADSAGLPSGPIPSQWPNAATHCKVDHGPDRTIPNGGRLDLTPGVWGEIYNASGNITLNFTSPGDYYLDKLDVRYTNLSYPAGVRLFVCDKVQLAKTTNTMPADPIYTEVAAFRPADDGHGFEVANGPWHGDVVVPTAGMHYGSGSSGSAVFNGRVWAEHVDLEHNVTVGPSPKATTTTSTSSTTPCTATSCTPCTATSCDDTVSSSTTTTAPKIPRPTFQP